MRLGIAPFSGLASLISPCRMEPIPRPRGSHSTSDREISCAFFSPYCVRPAGFQLRHRKVATLPITCRAIRPTAPAAPTFRKRGRCSPRAARDPWKPARAAHPLKARKDKHLPACRRLPRDLPRPSSIRPLRRRVEACCGWPAAQIADCPSRARPFHGWTGSAAFIA